MATAGTAEFEVSVEPKVRAVPDGQGRWISVQQYSTEVHEFQMEGTTGNGECGSCGGQEWQTDREGRLHLRYVQAPSPFTTHTAALLKIKKILDTAAWENWLTKDIKRAIEEAGL